MQKSPAVSNILLATLGASWKAIPEIFYFANLPRFSFYRKHSEYAALYKEREKQGIMESPDLRVVAPDGEGARSRIKELESWWNGLGRKQFGTLRVFRISGTGDLSSVPENERMAEAIMRVTLHAREEARQGGKALYLSLAGGWKTMAAYLQKAGFLFGADRLFHLVPDSGMEPKLEEASLQEIEGSPDLLSGLHPIVLGNEPAEELLFISSSDFPLPAGENPQSIRLPENSLLRELDEKLSEMRNVSQNFFVFQQLFRQDKHVNFRCLYRLPGSLLKRLQDERLGHEDSDQERDLRWLRSLPKADLHTHLGGAASARDLIDLGEANLLSPDSRAWMEGLEGKREFRDLSLLVESKKTREIRSLFGLGEHYLEGIGGLATLDQVPPYMGVSYFLSHFKGRPDLLEKVIYGDLVEKRPFRGISLSKYCNLGALGGSAILQTPDSLRLAVRRLHESAVAENVQYMEVRVSPANYTRGGMTIKDVVTVVLDTLKACYGEPGQKTRCKTNLIFIAARHADLSRISQEVAAAVVYAGNSPDAGSQYEPCVVGFDLAGEESKEFRPARFRTYFLPLFRNCLHITIHAGETDTHESVWEAIYELHAERIGHGITLRDEPGLLRMVRDRQIALEMCPTSNTQTGWFPDFSKREEGGEKARPYPLMEYFREGLTVTVNTDNRGISRTDLSREYLTAAHHTPGGISRWDILNLVKSGFKCAFLPFGVKEDLLGKADLEILGLLSHGES
ncbi:MAG: hypothetical protein HYU64_16360 [Armatimonadetes bacterium]|nr:hypothetical protein [Armatimonadota bacterium]